MAVAAMSLSGVYAARRGGTITASKLDACMLYFEARGQGRGVFFCVHF